MRNLIRFSLGTLVLAASAACSNSEQPAVSQELEQDLAKAGGATVQLTGNSAGRVDIVSSAERTVSPTPAPKSKSVAHAPSAYHGSKAATPSARRVTPVAAPIANAPEPAPTEVIRDAPQPAPTNIPQTLPQSRPRAPMPTTQREPRGGWRTPGDVIRNAPFPINP